MPRRIFDDGVEPRRERRDPATGRRNPGLAVDHHLGNAAGAGARTGWAWNMLSRMLRPNDSWSEGTDRGRWR